MILYLIQSCDTEQKRNNSLFWYKGQTVLSRNQRKNEITKQSKDIVHVDLEILKNSFRRFKKTKSFYGLRKKICGFEKLTMKIYGI